MSYYTFANLQYLDGETIDLSELNGDLLKLLDENGLHHDVSKDMANLFSKGEAFFNLYGGSAILEHLLRWVSAQRPFVVFGVQGRGEELRDVWVREFQGGAVQFEQGPFVDE